LTAPGTATTLSVMTTSRDGILAATVIALLAACNSASAPPATDEIGSVLISPATVTIGVGQSRQLSATVFTVSNHVVASPAVTWTSADASVASVDEDGRVTGHSAGQAGITAKSGGKAGTAMASVIASPPAEGDVTVDAGTVYQRINGWEATAWMSQWSCNDVYPTTTWDRYAPVVFDGAVDLGINRLRLELRSGAERPTDVFPDFIAGRIAFEDWRPTWYEAINDNSSSTSLNTAGFHYGELDLEIDRIALPLKQRLEARGEKLYISLDFVDFGRQSSFEHLHEPAEYAEFMLAAFQHIRSKYGWVPDGIEVVLEPDNGAVQFTGSEIGQAIVAAGDRLKAAGFSPDFIAPSGASALWSQQALPQILAVPGARQYLKELSYHRYRDVTTQTIRTIGDLGTQNGIRTAMLEHIGSGYEDLHQDLKLGMVSTWQQYTLAGCATGDPGGRHFLIDASDLSNPRVTMASRSHFLRQYFKWVRAGAVRVEASSAIGALDPLAFINADGSYVVVVRAGDARNFTIGGLPAGRYGVVYTVGPNDSSPQQSAIDAGDVTIAAGEALATGIPGHGVITIFAR